MNNAKDNSNKINENIYNANIRLVDKNKELYTDNKILRKKINQAIEFILDKSVEYKPGYRKVELDFKECSELLEILESELYEFE